MKVNDSTLSTLTSIGTSRTQETARSGQAQRTAEGNVSTGGDDIHLSELLRSLRALAADSPERQARLEKIARDYAQGAYKVDASATASRIIDDALQRS